MKPKKRKEQKQTARMVLRNHDHRDAIFDQKYHNMMNVLKKSFTMTMTYKGSGAIEVQELWSRMCSP